MICVPYRVSASQIPGAGNGLFTMAAIEVGRIIIAPSHIDATISLQELLETPDHPHSDSSIRWFEDHCTTSPDWPDECYVNHSFQPNALWHLGFVFALRDIAPGEEITVDYRYLIGPGVKMPFHDAVSGRAILGLGWGEKLVESTRQLLDLALQLRDKELHLTASQDSALALDMTL